MSARKKTNQSRPLALLRSGSARTSAAGAGDARAFAPSRPAGSTSAGAVVSSAISGVVRGTTASAEQPEAQPRLPSFSHAKSEPKGRGIAEAETGVRWGHSERHKEGNF